MATIKAGKTNQEWAERQAALRFLDNKWEVSFLVRNGNPWETVIGATVGEFKAITLEAATNIAGLWIRDGIVPNGFETHAPNWFTPLA